MQGTRLTCCARIMTCCRAQEVGVIGGIGLRMTTDAIRRANRNVSGE